jgi:hypothetical protein
MNFSSLRGRRYQAKPIDATLIMSGLYQGSIPSPGLGLADAGFTGVVFCAREYQPPSGRYPGLKTIHIPLDDVGFPLTLMEVHAVNQVARSVANEVRRGGKVLVTCAMGRNRSGLVSATAVVFLTGCTGKQAVQLVRSVRPNALTNAQFVDYLVSTYR